MAFGPAFDLASAAQRLKQDGRVHIQNVLAEADAEALLSDMDGARWTTALLGQEGILRLTPSMADALDVGERNRILTEVYAESGPNFRYLYDKFSIDAVIGAGRPCPPNFAALYAAFNSPQWLETFRTLTGDDRVARVDCHVSRYRPGHFLSAHDDRDPTSDRLFAYVLNLSKGWHVEWGGLLQFHDEEGHLSGAFTPRWNALNMFAVPQAHSVSMVTPSAKLDRFSITGWLLKAAQ